MTSTVDRMEADGSESAVRQQSLVRWPLCLSWGALWWFLVWAAWQGHVAAVVIFWVLAVI